MATDHHSWLHRWLEIAKSVTLFADMMSNSNCKYLSEFLCYQSPSILIQALLHFNLIVGFGILTLPKAFSEAGYVFGVVLLAWLGFMRSDISLPSITLSLPPLYSPSPPSLSPLLSLSLSWNNHVLHYHVSVPAWWSLHLCRISINLHY